MRGWVVDSAGLEEAVSSQFETLEVSGGRVVSDVAAGTNGLGASVVVCAGVNAGLDSEAGTCVGALVGAGLVVATVPAVLGPADSLSEEVSDVSGGAEAVAGALSRVALGRYSGVFGTSLLACSCGAAAG